MKKLEILHELYDKFKDKTEGLFHNTLWQIMINNVRANVQSAFVYIHGIPNDDQGRPIRINVGIADLNVSGYTPSTFSIKSTLTENEREMILEELNKKVFGITYQRAFEIEISSMKRQNINDNDQ